MAISAVYVGRAGCSLVLFKRNIFRSPAFSLRFFDVHVVAPAVSKRISAVLFPCERKGSRGVLLVEIHLPGPILMAKFGGRLGLCPPRVGPFRMANFGDRVGLCPPCEASPAVLGVWPFELYLPGPIIMAKFGVRVGLRPPREASRLLWACVRLSYISRGPSFWPRLVIEWVFVRRVRRLRQFWACLRLS